MTREGVYSGHTAQGVYSGLTGKLIWVDIFDHRTCELTAWIDAHSYNVYILYDNDSPYSGFKTLEEAEAFAVSMNRF